MQDEELMALEREGARIAKLCTDAFNEVVGLCSGDKAAAVAVLAGYLRYMLEEMPGIDPVEAVHDLCNRFGGMRCDWTNAILDRLGFEEIEELHTGDLS